MEKDPKVSAKQRKSDANHYVDLIAKLGLPEDTSLMELNQYAVPDIDAYAKNRLGLPENASEKRLQAALKAEKDARILKALGRFSSGR